MFTTLCIVMDRKFFFHFPNYPFCGLYVPDQIVVSGSYRFITAHSCDQQTNTQTHRPRYFCSNGLHLCSVCIRCGVITSKITEILTYYLTAIRVSRCLLNGHTSRKRGRIRSRSTSADSLSIANSVTHAHTHTHARTHARTHTHRHPFTGLFSGTNRVSRYQKGKTNLDFTKARDSEWQWHQLGHTKVCT